MAVVTVTPQAFSLVDFDTARIQEVAADLAHRAGLGDVDVLIEVDETTPMSRSRVASIDPVHLQVESGAFEDPRRPRQMSETAVVEVVGSHLLKVADRRDPAFSAPRPADLDLAHRVAWDVYARGRLARFGHRDQRQRWLYHFRNRCGFSDATDVAFAALWTGEGLAWPAISALVAGAVAASSAA